MNLQANASTSAETEITAEGRPSRQPDCFRPQVRKRKLISAVHKSGVPRHIVCEKIILLKLALLRRSIGLQQKLPAALVGSMKWLLYYSTTFTRARKFIDGAARQFFEEVNRR
jgi:hypothetical protein